MPPPSPRQPPFTQVGRAFQLSRVRAVDESNPEAGQVLAAVMHVADVLAVGASAAGGAATSVAHPPEQAALHALALEYLSTDEAVAEAKLQPPVLVPVAQASLNLKALDAPADVAVGDSELLLLETQPDVVKKIKKAFCEPGNVAHCPPIALAQEVVLAYGEGAAPRQLVVPSKGAEPQSFGSPAQLHTPRLVTWGRLGFRARRLRPPQLLCHHHTQPFNHRCVAFRLRRLLTYETV